MTGSGERWLDRIDRFAASRAAMVAIAVWGFGEAIVVPIVPDVALDLLGLASPRRGLRLFAIAVAASILGSAVLFALAVAQLPSTEAFVLAVPAINQPMLDAAKATVASGDPASLALFGPGTPLKVYTVAWASGVGTWLGLLVGVVVNRLTRIGPALLLAMVAGWIAPGWLRRHERLVLAAYTLGWAALYAGYWFGAT